MNDNTTAEENTMSDTSATNGESKTVKAKKARKSEVKAKRAAAPAKRSSKPVRLVSLAKGEPRTKQQMFRTTIEEHNTMVKAAEKEGYVSMTEFFRVRCGLPR
jgi:hypothetical protein